VSAWSALGLLSRGRLATALASFIGSLSICGAAPAQHRPSPAPEATCGGCHAKVANLYAHAPMRNAMQEPGSNPALDAHPNLTVHQNGYSYAVQTRNGKSTYTVSDSTGSLTLDIGWIFGMHSQTWVLEKDGQFYESMVSYFARGQVLSTTPGDDQIVPHTLDEAIGRKLSIWELPNCINCHATGFDRNQKPAAQKLTPGLNCERCHAGSAEHMADALDGDFSTAPRSLKEMDAGEAANFCGQCHRTWDKVVREGWHGPPTVRFQPYRLENSKCFDSSDRRISCLTCHDPHQEVTHNEAFYDTKCLACHSPAASSASAARPKSCPTAKDKCVSCHMPRVELAGGHAVFTDHQIRIVRPGEPYPN